MDLDTLIKTVALLMDDAVLIAQVPKTLDQPSTAVWCNEAFTRDSGYALSDIAGRTLDIMFGPETDLEKMRANREALRAGRPVRQQVVRYNKDRSPVFVDVTVKPIVEADGSAKYWFAVQRDSREIAGLKRRLSEAEARQALADRRLRAAIEALPDALAIYDVEERLVMCNSQYRKLYPQSAPAMQPGARFEDILRFGLARGQYPAAVGREEAWLAERLRAHRASNGPIEQELPGDRHLRIHEVRALTGDIVGLRIDVTEMRRRQRDIERYADALSREKRDAEARASTDALTGLLNRRGLDAWFTRFRERASPEEPVVFLHIDLDRFKQINDTLGHAAGDAVLKHVAGLLKEVARPCDALARIGGDEFVIVCHCVEACRCADDQCVPQEVAEGFLELLSAPFVWSGRRVRLSASVGVAASFEASAEALMTQADLALYRAKETGRNRIVAYEPQMAQAMEATARLSEEILAGLERGEFFPYFQPQVDARSFELVGVEALARWRHPSRGVVDPVEFLSVAEDLHAIAEIDRVILHRAGDALARLVADDVGAPKLSVNVSRHRLLDPRLASDVDAIAGRGFDIAVELLESICFEDADDDLTAALEALRARGVALEIDDFGSGRSSIRGIERVRPKRMKIDAAIVAPVVACARRRRLVSSLIDIGACFDVEVIAEGVETIAHAHILRALGCDALQGAAFAPALPEADFARWVRAHARRAPLGRGAARAETDGDAIDDTVERAAEPA